MSNENESKTETAIAKKAPISVGKFGVELSTMEDLFRFSNAVAVSGFAPKGMEKPESIMIAIQHGFEIGLKPMQALQSIAVINGRPGIYGDAALAIVRNSGELEDFEETIEGEGDKMEAVCRVTRKGFKVYESRFSVADAKLAGLWDKAGPWKQYPRRMLKFRARGFGLRDTFGDYLRGLKTVEELQDYIETTGRIIQQDDGVKPL